MQTYFASSKFERNLEIRIFLHQVRQMRDLHIEALVRQYGGEQGQELAQCPVVKEYR